MKRILTLCLALIMIVSFVHAEGGAPSSWAKTVVDEVFENNMLDKRMQGNYQSEISRRDFAYLGVKIYESITGKTTTMGDASFPDTSDMYVLKAKNTGIIKGYDDGTFRPDQAINRQELAVLFANTLLAAQIDLSIQNYSAFSDDTQISSWAKESVYITRALGIVKGVGNNAFSPKGTATREQAIIMFKRVIDKYNSLPTEPVDTRTVYKGTVAPDFVVDLLSGGTTSLNVHRGKPIVITFFTSWCPPCLEQLAVLDNIEARYGSKVQFIGINLYSQDNEDDVKSVVSRYGINFPVGLDNGTIKAHYGIVSIPTTVFIDEQGMIVDYISGTMTEDAVERIVIDLQ